MIITQLNISASQYKEENLKKFIDDAIRASAENPDEIKWQFNETGIVCLMIWYDKEKK